MKIERCPILDFTKKYQVLDAKTHKHLRNGDVVQCVKLIRSGKAGESVMLVRVKDGHAVSAADEEGQIVELCGFIPGFVSELKIVKRQTRAKTGTKAGSAAVVRQIGNRKPNQGRWARRGGKPVWLAEKLGGEA